MDEEIRWQVRWTKGWPVIGRTSSRVSPMSNIPVESEINSAVGRAGSDGIYIGYPRCLVFFTVGSIFPCTCFLSFRCPSRSSSLTVGHELVISSYYAQIPRRELQLKIIIGAKS